MPLLDHFHPPLHPGRHWESFHARWANSIADALNETLLPEEYFAEIQVHIGSRVEVDVATLHEADQPPTNAQEQGGGVAVAPARAWAPPQAAFMMPAVFPDSAEVLVYHELGGPNLVAAVELVSPGNKNRADERRGFAAKCVTYLQQGVGLIVIDIVTGRRANLHNELVDLMGFDRQFRVASEGLYAIAYRPIRRTDAERIDVWPAELSIGGTLPLLPLALNRGICLPLDLEQTYTDACRRSRLP